VDPAKAAEVRQFLSHTLRFDGAAVAAVMEQCGVQRLDDLRQCQTTADKVVSCGALSQQQREALLVAMRAPEGVPLEEATARLSVRTTWHLSVAQLETEDGAGPAAVHALLLFSLMAPDGIPVDLPAYALPVLPSSHLVDYLHVDALEAGAGVGAGWPALDRPPAAVSDLDSVDWLRATSNDVPALHGCYATPVTTRLRNRCENVVSALARFSLVAREAPEQPDSDSVFGMHRLLQQTVADSLAPDQVRTLVSAACLGVGLGTQRKWDARDQDWDRAMAAAEQWTRHGAHLTTSSLVLHAIEASGPAASARLSYCMHVTVTTLRSIGHAALAMRLGLVEVAYLQGLHQGQPHLNTAAAMYNLGMNQMECGELSAATASVQASLDMQQELGEGESKAVGVCLGSLGAMRRLEDPGGALQLLQRAVHVLRRTGDSPDDAELAKALGQLGITYQLRGDLHAALPILRESADMKLRLWQGRDSADVAISMGQLGQLLQAMGNCAAALPLLQDSVAMERRLWRGRDVSSLATAVNNLGHLHQAMGNLRAALPCLQEALAMKQRLNPDNPATRDVAIAMHNVGTILQLLDREEEAPHQLHVHGLWLLQGEGGLAQAGSGQSFSCMLTTSFGDLVNLLYSLVFYPTVESVLTGFSVESYTAVCKPNS
jgi:tetratricopeptide (TPR) repeat protein